VVKENAMPAKKKTPRAPAEEAIVPPAPVEPIAPVAPAAPEPIVFPAPVPPVPPAVSSGKPGTVAAIAILTLISGIVNIIIGLVGAISMAGTFLLCCLSPFCWLPIALGIFEIIYAAKLLPTPIQPVQPNQTIAILEIVCLIFGNVFAAITGILALVFYSDPSVKAYFAKINGQG
jgi:hypothetical protein